jgi:hypothetical protein
MLQTNHSLIFTAECRDVVQRLMDALREANLQALLTFDLQSARLSQASVCCPVHTSTHCSCNMLVLSIYSCSGGPFILIIQGRDGMTQLGWGQAYPEEAFLPVRLLVSSAVYAGKVSH